MSPQRKKMIENGVSSCSELWKASNMHETGDWPCSFTGSENVDHMTHGEGLLHHSTVHVVGLSVPLWLSSMVMLQMVPL